ncbi:MAG: metallophosphoesterase [Actinomycetota bacterium]|nr:metallophosphoesterase [Actinomycetota bacterium]
MKLLLVSDVHLDAPFAWAGPELARSRRQAIRSAFQRACDVVQEQQVDALLVAGDLYEHDKFSPDTAEFLRKAFGEVGVPVFLAPGNHDWLGPKSLYRQVEWSSNVHLFEEDRLTPRTLADGLTLWGAAHRVPANTDGFLDGFTVDRGGVHLALFHGSERGDFAWQESGKTPHAPFSAEQIPAAGLHHAFVGHFHTPHFGPWHTYPGNPEPLTFGEQGERGAVLIEVGADGSIARTSLPLSSTEVHDIEVDLAGCTNSQEIRNRVQQALTPLHGLVRATLKGEVSPEADIRISDLDGLGSQLTAFVPRLGDVTFAYDIDALESELTVRGQFVRDVRDSDLDDAMRRKVLITGLRALDGRANELEVR